MEYTNCIICNSDQNSTFLNTKDRFGLDEFTLVKCKCGFVFLNPRPESSKILDYYNHPHYHPHTTPSRTYRIVQKIALFWKKSILQKFIKSGKLLDIGGGSGEFCNYMSQFNWDVTLQDSLISNSVISKNSQVKTVSSLKELSEDSNFDLFTLWHSLEHIHEIESFFSFINSHSRNNSLLALAVPNINAAEQKYFGKYWAPWDAPRHLYHFSILNLHSLLKKNGWVVEKTYSMYQDTPYNILLSQKGKSIIKQLNGLFILLISWLRIIRFGVDRSSSFLVICKKL